MNELEEQALAWLRVFVDSRKSKRAASLELGHDGNWAGRLLSPKHHHRVNWDFDAIALMAENLGISALQLQEAIRLCIAPAGKPKEQKARAKPRRAAKVVHSRRIGT